MSIQRTYNSAKQTLCNKEIMGTTLTLLRIENPNDEYYVFDPDENLYSVDYLQRYKLGITIDSDRMPLYRLPSVGNWIPLDYDFVYENKSRDQEIEYTLVEVSWLKVTDEDANKLRSIHEEYENNRSKK